MSLFQQEKTPTNGIKGEKSGRRMSMALHTFVNKKH